MAGGGKVRIIDEPSDPTAARVVNGRLLVSSTGGGGGGGDVNIAEIGGNPVTTTLPVSGTVAISGTVPISGTVTIQEPLDVNVQGIVDVTGSGVVILSTLSLTPGTASGNLGKERDAASGASDTGVSVLAVRDDAGALPMSAQGDYAPFLVNAAGRLWVTWDGETIDSITTVGEVSSVRAITPGTSAQNLGKAEDAVHASGDTGVMALAVRQDTATALAANNDYIPLIVDSSGRLHVNVGTGSVSISALVPGTGATNLGKAEDAVHANGDVGVQVLAVRRDTLASSTSNNGDYATFSVDSVGALWTRNAGVTTIALSGSTRGRPIQLTGTTSGTAVTLHTATTTAGQIDRLFIDLTNTSASAVVVTIEFGTTGVGNEIDVTVPANATVRAVDGSVIGGGATDTVRAYATAANVINVTGRVERLS